jgi:hypothetical protein
MLLNAGQTLQLSVVLNQRLDGPLPFAITLQTDTGDIFSVRQDVLVEDGGKE